MELALVLRELWGRKRGLAVGVVIALTVAILSAYQINGIGLKAKPLVYSAASTQVFIDSPSTVLGNTNPAVAELTTVATLDANFMTSPALLDIIGKKVGLSGDQLEATGPMSSLPRAIVEPTALQRNVELTGETAPYRLDYSNNPNLPLVGIATQAPSTKMAVALANAAASGLAQYVASLQDANHVPPQQRVAIRQLGAPTGSVVNAGVGKKLAAMVFFGVMFVWCTLMLVATRFRRSWRESGRLFAERAEAPVAGGGRGLGGGVKSSLGADGPLSDRELESLLNGDAPLPHRRMESLLANDGALPHGLGGSLLDGESPPHHAEETPATAAAAELNGHQPGRSGTPRRRMFGRTR